MLARSKLNCIESNISETLINNEISHEYIMTILNKEKKYRELKERIRMMNSQRCDIEKISLIEEGKKQVLIKLLSIMKLLITENINPKVSNTSNAKKTILSKCVICGSKNSRFIKDQEVKGLLSNLGVRTPLSKVPILGDILL